MNNRNPWTTAGFQKRLKEFMRDNPDLTKSEACSILGKRGAENRKKSQLSRCEKQKSAQVNIQNFTVNFYLTEGNGYSIKGKIKNKNPLAIMRSWNLIFNFLLQISRMV